MPANWAAVLCQPVGREYFYAHRACRLLARRLSKAGVHVLRFDYSGTGDSAGELDGLSATLWIDDVRYAVDELKDLSGMTSVALVGVRFGAALAAEAASGRDDVSSLILWDPLAAPAGRLAGSPDPTIPPDFLDHLREAVDDPGKLRLPPTRVLHTSSRASCPPELLSRAVEEVWCPGPEAWSSQDDFGSPGVPVDALDRIVAWLTGK
ncbi:MAG: alpha/beta fold hydrolase [Chromatiales bacterium]|nr:alpha/beta fold hydrolase [Chromatiales bacterium]